MTCHILTNSNMNSYWWKMCYVPLEGNFFQRRWQLITYFHNRKKLWIILNCSVPFNSNCLFLYFCNTLFHWYKYTSNWLISKDWAGYRTCKPFLSQLITHGLLNIASLNWGIISHFYSFVNYDVNCRSMREKELWRYDQVIIFFKKEENKSLNICRQVKTNF